MLKYFSSETAGAVKPLAFVSISCMKLQIRIHFFKLNKKEFHLKHPKNRHFIAKTLAKFTKIRYHHVNRP